MHYHALTITSTLTISGSINSWMAGSARNETPRENRRHNVVLVIPCSTNAVDVLAAMLVHCGFLYVSFVESQKVYMSQIHWYMSREGRDVQYFVLAVNPSKWFELEGKVALGKDAKIGSEIIEKQ